MRIDKTTQNKREPLSGRETPIAAATINQMLPLNISKASHRVRDFLLLGLLFLTLLAIFSFVGSERLIAKDEGFYLEAARLVSRGQLPYLDFFYPQMPYIPFILAPFTSSWELARFFCAFLLAGIALATFIFARDRGCPTGLAMLWLAAFVTNHFTLAWLVTSQSYIFSLSFGFASFLLLTGLACKPETSTVNPFSIARVLVAGVLLGCAVGCRLYFAALIPIGMIWIWLSVGNLRAVGWYTLGGVLSLLPAFGFFLADPDVFLYNNLVYHTERSQKAFVETLANKEVILRTILGLRDTKQFQSLGVPALMWTSLAFFVALGIVRRRVDLLSLTGISLALVSLVPSPTYVQYFCLTTPLLVCGLLSSIQTLSDAKPIPRALVFASWGTPVLLLLANLVGIQKDFDNYSRTGEGVIGLNSRIAADWNLRRLYEIREELRTIPGEQEVFALWSGYLLGTSHRMMMGLENHFGPSAARRMRKSERLRFRLRSTEGLLAGIRAGEAQIAIVSKQQLKRSLRVTLADQCFKARKRLGDIFILERQATGSC